MEWTVLFGYEFRPEFIALPEEVQTSALGAINWRQFGPRLGRPYADTLKASHYANMKELRFDVADGVWRLAFAFDPNGRLSC